MSKLIEYAREKESQGQLTDAYNYYEMAMEENGCPFDIRKDMGNVLNKMARYDEALDCFNLVLEMDDAHIESYFGKGISYLGLGKWDEAYNCFGEIIDRLDKKDANCWYYLAIIANYLKDDEYFKDQINKDYAYFFFDRFKELDNENYQEIRSKYQFGLLFDYYKNDLFDCKKIINVDRFKEELRLYGESQEEIDLDIKTLPYDDLLDKIKTLKEIQHDNDIKQIIIKVLKNEGFSDDEIINTFELESLESLKDEVILLNSEVKFPDLDSSIRIPLYRKTPLGNFIFDNMTSEYDLIKSGLSEFNKFVVVLNSMHQDDFIYYFLNRNPNHINKKKYYHRGISLKKSNKHFIKFFMDINSNKRPKWNDIAKAYNYCPKINFNIINIQFFIATFWSKYGDNENKINSVEFFSKLIDYIAYLKNKDVIYLNFANVTYDLCLKYPEFINTSLACYKEYLKLHPDDDEIKYLVKSLEVYKSKLQK